MQWPWRITASFGAMDDVHKTPHSGIDLAAPMDSPIHSISGGVVDHVSREGAKGFGNAVWIREPDGYKIVYGHLDKVRAYTGERIHRDDVIGLSGDTGHSTGAHLHIGVMSPSGKWVDPNDYFSHWNWFHLSSNRIKEGESEFVVGHIEHVIIGVAKALAADFGEFALHQIAPVALIIFSLSMLGVIVGMVKPRRWAFYSGLIAMIGYRMGWSS